MLILFLSPESQSLNKEKRALYIKSTIKHNKYVLSVLNAGSATCKHINDTNPVKSPTEEFTRRVQKQNKAMLLRIQCHLHSATQ